jgi:hypothetical protein
MRPFATQAPRVAVCAIATVMVIMAHDPATAQRAQTPAAQREQWTGTPPPGWEPYYNSEIGNVTAAQRAAAVRVLKEIERILLQVPELASPKGFKILPQFWGGTRMPGLYNAENPDNVVAYALRVYLLPIQSPLTSCLCITVTVNGRVGGSSGQDEQGREIYVVSDPRGRPMPLATQVYGELLPTYDQALDGFSDSWVRVVMTSEPDSKTVTREEYYKFRIFQTEGEGGATLAATRRSLEKTAYQRWLEGAQQRRKNQEATLQAAARNMLPEEVAKLRRDFEETERQTAETLKGQEADEREGNRQALAQFTSVGDAMRAELESMTPAERSMPAIIDPKGGGRLRATTQAMADRDSPTMWQVFTPNYDFWRARKSPVEVHSIVVFIGHGAGMKVGEPEIVHNALRQTFNKLDWAALNKLLDVTR